MKRNRGQKESGDGYSLLGVGQPGTFIPILGWCRHFPEALKLSREFPGSIIVHTSGPEYDLTGASYALRCVKYLVTRPYGRHGYESREEFVR